MHLIVGCDPGTLQFILNITLWPLGVGSAIVTPLLMQILLLLFLDEFPRWYPDDVLRNWLEPICVYFILIFMILLVNCSLYVNSQPTGFNFGLLLRLFLGWWLPQRSLVLAFDKNLFVLLYENIVQHLFWVNQRLIF